MSGNLLREARKRSGMTQRVAAARAGVPQSTIARIESGAMSPRLDTLTSILSALGFTIDLAPLSTGEGVDRSLIQRMLRLTPTERVQYVADAHAAIQTLRDASMDHSESLG